MTDDSQFRLNLSSLSGRIVSKQVGFVHASHYFIFPSAMKKEVSALNVQFSQMQKVVFVRDSCGRKGTLKWDINISHYCWNLEMNKTQESQGHR